MSKLLRSIDLANSNSTYHSAQDMGLSVNADPHVYDMRSQILGYLGHPTFAWSDYLIQLAISDYDLSKYERVGQWIIRFMDVKCKFSLDIIETEEEEEQEEEELPSPKIRKSPVVLWKRKFSFYVDLECMHDKPGCFLTSSFRYMYPKDERSMTSLEITTGKESIFRGVSQVASIWEHDNKIFTVNKDNQRIHELEYLPVDTGRSIFTNTLSHRGRWTQTRHLYEDALTQAVEKIVIRPPSRPSLPFLIISSSASDVQVFGRDENRPRFVFMCRISGFLFIEEVKVANGDELYVCCKHGRCESYDLNTFERKRSYVPYQVFSDQIEDDNILQQECKGLIPFLKKVRSLQPFHVAINSSYVVCAYSDYLVIVYDRLFGSLVKQVKVPRTLLFPQRMEFVPGTNLLVISFMEDGDLQIYDAPTMEIRWRTSAKKKLFLENFHTDKIYEMNFKKLRNGDFLMFCASFDSYVTVTRFYLGDKENMICEGCGKSQKDGLLRCSMCKGVMYCGRECQMKDWRFHKMICGRKLKRK